MTEQRIKSATLCVMLLLVGLLGGGCTQAARDRSTVHEPMGAIPESFALPQGSMALIVIDSAECTSCDVGLQSLLYTHRVAPEVIALAYSRVPNPRERRELAIRGLLSGALVDTTLAVVGSHAFVIRRGPTGRTEAYSPTEASTVLAEMRHLLSPSEPRAGVVPGRCDKTKCDYFFNCGVVGCAEGTNNCSCPPSGGGELAP